MKWMLLIVISTLSLNLFAADPKAQELIKKFDVGYYHPQDKGLKELVVRVELDDLTKQLNDQLIFGKLKEVYFKLYWMAPNSVEVEVIGMPDGFTEIKDELKGMVASRLDMIVPQNLELRFKGYDLKYQKGATGGEELLATDTTQTKMVHEFVAKFDKENNLTSLIGRKPLGTEDSSLVYAKLPWSGNKWILTSMNLKASDPTQTTITDTEIDYVAVDGYGFPKSIKSKTKQSIVNGDKKPIERSFDSELSFKDYKVNSGEAAAWFKKTKTP